MPTCPLIADPARYRPCIQNLLTDGEEVREYWLKLFEAHLETLADLPMPGDGLLSDRPDWDRFAADYLAGLAELRRDPARRGKLTVLELTIFREEQFAAHGFPDPFAELKRRENELALQSLGGVLRDIDATPPARRLEKLIRGLFAGNLFDMGSKAAVDAFGEGTFDFLAARDNIGPRHWPVDDLDAWQARLESAKPPYRQALAFVDNCGPDVVLGVLPLARYLTGLGARVVLAANTQPALNDVTATELRALLATCARLDARLREYIWTHQITVVESGCAAPLIDLTDLSPECCDAAATSDLLILEGMGRAIESNYDARFTVDTVKLALIKDRMVASVLGVSLFDPIFRFDPAAPMPH
ncbi:MAG TPA: ARMT1-like domain-containing protein [Phycisphaerae bacterium]|nr:ARMT1-like domain-containing protein [Phycisphaerae bacterium]